MSAVSKKPLLEVGFRGEGNEQGLDSRRSPAAWLEIDTPALGPGDCSPAPSSLLPMRTALLGDFFFFLTFSSPSSSPAPLSLAFPFGSREASAVALDRLELRAKRAEKKEKVSLLKKKKKKKSLMEALFYQRYQNLNCKRASVRPSPPPSSAPSLRRVSGFQSESCCVCSAPAPLFLVLKRERIPFLNLRPDAQAWEELGGGGEEGGNEKKGERERRSGRRSAGRGRERKKASESSSPPSSASRIPRASARRSRRSGSAVGCGEPEAS